MFAFLIGIQLSEYIRRRRLTLAAFELQNSNEKIIDLALKYGYNSPDSFSRAFLAMHGVTPSKAREKGISLKAYPRVTFSLSIKGVVEDNTTDYYIAAITEKDSPKTLCKLEIPTLTWSIFEITGPMPTAMADIWGRIFSEWFPTSGYEHAEAPEVEWYSNGDMSSSDYKSEIWIPVIKK